MNVRANATWQLPKPTETVMANVAQEHVVEKDREVFQEMLSEAIGQLHEGSVARYRLRLSEFAAWKSRIHGA